MHHCSCSRARARVCSASASQSLRLRANQIPSPLAPLLGSLASLFLAWLLTFDTVRCGRKPQAARHGMNLQPTGTTLCTDGARLPVHQLTANYIKIMCSPAPSAIRKMTPAPAFQNRVCLCENQQRTRKRDPRSAPLADLWTKGKRTIKPDTLAIHTKGFPLPSYCSCGPPFSPSSRRIKACNVQTAIVSAL